MSSGPPTHVVYLAGAHRSGTTLLSAVLGSLVGSFDAGELHEIWNGIRTGRPCACGRPVLECEVWAPVLARWASEVRDGADGPADTTALAARVEALRGREGRVWHTPLLVLRAWSRRPGRTASGHRMEALYGAVVGSGHPELVVDATKVPSGAALAGAQPGVRVSVVHLVRDPRGTVHSWSAPKRASGLSRGDDLDTLSMTNAALRWLGYNLLSHLVRLVPGVRYRLCRYEDLTADPVRTVGALADWLGVQVPPTLFVDASTVQLAPSHAVAGNPDRFGASTRTIRCDERWRTDMPACRQRLAMVMTWPLAARYGYTGPGRRTRHARPGTAGAEAGRPAGVTAGR